MKLIRIFNRSIRDSFKSIFRNLSLSVASISCTVITLILVALAILATENVTDMTDKIEKDLTMIVFVDNKASEEEINNVKSELNNIDNIDSITFRSKDEIKKSIKESLDSDPTSKQLIQQCKKAGKGIAYCYKGDQSGDECLIKIKTEEFK